MATDTEVSVDRTTIENAKGTKPPTAVVDSGLAGDEAHRRLDKFGANAIPADTALRAAAAARPSHRDLP
jgi:hypothetical protein